MQPLDQGESLEIERPDMVEALRALRGRLDRFCNGFHDDAFQFFCGHEALFSSRQCASP
jgi:hypothetical protein